MRRKAREGGLTQETWLVIRVNPKLIQYDRATPSSRAEQLIATSGPRSRASILISDCLISMCQRARIVNGIPCTWVRYM